VGGCVLVYIEEDEGAALEEKRWRHSWLQQTDAIAVPVL
jgi:hypothetical protein